MVLLGMSQTCRVSIFIKIWDQLEEQAAGIMQGKSLGIFPPLIKASYNWSSTRKGNMNISKPVYFHHCTHWGKCMIFACNHAAVEVTNEVFTNACKIVWTTYPCKKDQIQEASVLGWGDIHSEMLVIFFFFLLKWGKQLHLLIRVLWSASGQSQVLSVPTDMRKARHALNSLNQNSRSELPAKVPTQTLVQVPVHPQSSPLCVCIGHQR